MCVCTAVGAQFCKKERGGQFPKIFVLGGCTLEAQTLSRIDPDPERETLGLGVAFRSHLYYAKRIWSEMQRAHWDTEDASEARREISRNHQCLPPDHRFNKKMNFRCNRMPTTV